MPREGGGGYSGFQVTGVMEGFFGGCEIFDFRIFLGRKILASIFRVFKTNFLFFLLYHLMLSGTFYDWVFGMEFFGG